MLPNKQLTVPVPGMEPESVDIVEERVRAVGPPAPRDKLAES